MNGTAICGERVVVIEVRRGRVNLRTGRIASKNSIPAHADDPNETVVLGDRRFHPTTDGSEEAYQRLFRVDDIHLLKEQEAQSLQDPEAAETWFGTIYQDRLISRIHRALKRLPRK
jgi:hypothetical protein